MICTLLYQDTEEITAFNSVNDLSIWPLLPEGHGKSVSNLATGNIKSIIKLLENRILLLFINIPRHGRYNWLCWLKLNESVNQMIEHEIYETNGISE